MKKQMLTHGQGWNENKEQGDAFFQQQRARADTADAEDERRFYVMMMQIVEEMEPLTGALTPPAAFERDLKVLDICM